MEREPGSHVRSEDKLRAEAGGGSSCTPGLCAMRPWAALVSFSAALGKERNAESMKQSSHSLGQKRMNLK